MRMLSRMRAPAGFVAVAFFPLASVNVTLFPHTPPVTLRCLKVPLFHPIAFTTSACLSANFHDFVQVSGPFWTKQLGNGAHPVGARVALYLVVVPSLTSSCTSSASGSIRC